MTWVPNSMLHVNCFCCRYVKRQAVSALIVLHFVPVEVTYVACKKLQLFTNLYRHPFQTPSMIGLVLLTKTLT